MNEIGLYLKKISNQLERGRNLLLKEYNLTGTQMDVLEYLYHHSAQENTLSGITSFFGVQHTSVLHVLKLLEKKQLIYKTEPERGSRFRFIYLTGQGMALVQKNEEGIARGNKIMFAGMSDQEIQVLQEQLIRIYQNLISESPTIQKEK